METRWEPPVLRPQELSVTEQLDAGVRYLDLRIAHMLQGSEKNLHFVHMVYTSALVEVGAWGGATPVPVGCGISWGGKDTHSRSRGGVVCDHGQPLAISGLGFLTILCL